LGRSRNEENHHPWRNAWSDNTSSSISKCETHFNDFLCVSCWRIISPLESDIAEFVTYSRTSQKQGVRFGRDFTFKFDQKPYINAGIFLDYIKTIFLPYIDTFHALVVSAQEIAVLLMDNCLVHVSDHVIHIFTQAKVCVRTFAPHTTQVFQVLDFTLFRIRKQGPMYELPFDDDIATVKFIMKVYHNFTQALMPSNVYGTFHALVLEFEKRKESYRLLFDKEKLRGSANCQELWSVEFPLDQLSGRRHITRFEWIKKPE
jgi:hypothetical protein